MDVVMHHPPLNLDNLGNRRGCKDGLIDEVRREVPPATKDSSQSLQTSDTTVGIGVAESSGFARKICDAVDVTIQEDRGEKFVALDLTMGLVEVPHFEAVEGHELVSETQLCQLPEDARAELILDAPQVESVPAGVGIVIIVLRVFENLTKHRTNVRPATGPVSLRVRAGGWVAIENIAPPLRRDTGDASGPMAKEI